MRLTRWRDQSGLVGKAAVFWLLLVAVLGVAAVDTVSKIGRNGCKVDPPTGRVTITLKTVASTVLAHRFGPTEEYVDVLVSETNGPSNV